MFSPLSLPSYSCFPLFGQFLSPPSLNSHSHSLNHLSNLLFTCFLKFFVFFYLFINQFITFGSKVTSSLLLRFLFFFYFFLFPGQLPPLLIFFFPTRSCPLLSFPLSPSLVLSFTIIYLFFFFFLVVAVFFDKTGLCFPHFPPFFLFCSIFVSQNSLLYFLQLGFPLIQSKGFIDLSPFCFKSSS